MTDTNQQGLDRLAPQPAFSERLRHSKALLPTMAVMGVTVLALAAALVTHRSEAQPGGPQPMVQGGPYAQGGQPMAQAAQYAQAAPYAQGSQYPQATAPSAAQPAHAQLQRQPAPVAHVARAPVCRNCGTVESVTPVQRSAPTSGVGAVAGGVAGALLGNQVGGGNGRAAMTVLGAVGGGFAGNAIEKNMKTQTSYQMRVRMRDGSVRTVEQATALAAGSPVLVERNTVRLAPVSQSAAQSMSSGHSSL
ncbi:MAG: glycine zipper 2TM domain-containing protein [Burkholderiaceae bacterium]